MKEWLIHSEKKPITVIFDVESNNSSTPIYVAGFDPFNANSFYFKSRFLITGRETLTINCPQSPSYLKIYVWGDKLPFTLHSIKSQPLARQEPADPIIIFVERFSRISGLLRPGFYENEEVPFGIDFRRKLYENGVEHPTPARIMVDEPIIEVSENKFDAMSIPERVMILLHEVAHNYINYDQDDEEEADDQGWAIYKDLGYPKIEAMNAFANIMPDTDENVQRMYNLINL